MAFLGLDELAIWLIPISVAIFLVQQYALYLVLLYITYFVVCRVLENVTLGKLETRPVLITGCDSGFGQGLTLKCLKNGMPVFSACFDEKGEKGLRAEAKKIPNGDKLLETFLLDVRSEESFTKARAFVEGKIAEKGYKGLWGLVNNAGIGHLRGWDDWQKPEVYQLFWEVNALGVIRTTHTFKHLIKRVKGRIVNVSSVTGKVPLPTIAPYSVSKMAVAAYSDCIRAELSQWGVKVAVLEPGFFKTPQANPQAALDDCTVVWNRTSQEVKDEYGEAYFDWSKHAITNFLEYKCQQGAYKVVDAYFNALTSFYPRCRYQIGYDSIFEFTTLQYLPTRWQDWFFRAYTKYVACAPPTKVSY